MKNVKLLISVGLIVGMVSCGKKGCMDPMSLAYDSEATKDDGNCTYPANEKRSLVFKFTATWCSYCGEWGAEYVDNIYSDFSTSTEVISIHRNDNFSVDIGDFLFSQLTPQGVPAFFVGTSDMGYTGYGTINSAIQSELTEQNEIAMATSFTTGAGVMNIKVQSQLSDPSSSNGSDLYLAIYLLEDGQVAPQQVAGTGEVSNFVHNHILRTEANGSPFGVPITFTDGNNLSEVNANLAPSTIWTHENLYPLAVIWRMNGNNYEFVNFAK